MARKTFSVEFIRNKTNMMLKDSTCNAASREGMIAILTEILHESGNYHGFRYLMVDEVPKGHNPGVRYAEDGSMLPYEERFVNVDDTRRSYY